MRLHEMQRLCPTQETLERVRRNSRNTALLGPTQSQRNVFVTICLKGHYNPPAERSHSALQALCDACYYTMLQLSAALEELRLHSAIFAVSLSRSERIRQCRAFSACLNTCQPAPAFTGDAAQSRASCSARRCNLWRSVLSRPSIRGGCRIAPAPEQRCTGWIDRASPHFLSSNIPGVRVQRPRPRCRSVVLPC